MDAVDAMASVAASAQSLWAAHPSGQRIEPQWLHTLGQISGVLLMLELCFALLLICALAFGIAYAMYWTHANVTPLLERYSAQAQRTLAVVERGSDRVVEGIAEFHGRRQGIEAALRVFFFGPKAAESLLNGRKPATLPGGETRATLPRSSNVTTFELVDRPLAEDANTPDTDAPLPGDQPPAEGAAQAAQPHAPHARQSSAPTWRSLPAGNTTIATDDSAPRRQARQIGRAGTVSGTRAGTATGVPSLGLA